MGVSAAQIQCSMSGRRNTSTTDAERPTPHARRLPSGAGHDAMILAEVTDVGMVFVRCGAGGVSHNPAETITAEDAGAAVRALLAFLRELRFRA